MSGEQEQVPLVVSLPGVPMDTDNINGSSVQQPSPATGRTPTPTNALSKEVMEDCAENYPWMGHEELEKLGYIFGEWNDEDGNGEISCEKMGKILRKVVRDIFDQIDHDGNGWLDRKEVGVYLYRLGLSLPNSAIDGYYKEMRQGNTEGGGVTFNEFEMWWEGYDKGDVSTEELKDLFDEVDEDGSGMIDVGEFVKMISLKMDGKDIIGKGFSAVQMVRMALDSVRDDVRAIYGSSAKPKGALERLRDIESMGRQRACFFRPDGTSVSDQLRKSWDVIQVFLLSYVALAVPYRMGFTIDIAFGSFWFWIEAIVDVYFALDIAINFRTAFRTDEGELVIHPKLIAKNYLRGWFSIDVAACFPATYIGLMINGTDSSQAEAQKLKALKIVRLFRLAKMLRLARVRRVIKRLDEDWPGIWTCSRLFSLVLIIMYIAHLVACGWYAAGLTTQVLADDGGINGTGSVLLGWVHGHPWDMSCVIEDTSMMTVLTADGDLAYISDDCDLWESPIGWGTRYLDSYYYAITTLTTVGYGDRTPTTDHEKVFSVITELVGGMIFGILAGTLSSMIAEANAKGNEIEAELDEIKDFMLAKGVKRELRREVMSKMEILSRGSTFMDDEAVLGRLPGKFRKKLLLAMYRPQLIQCPLFLGLDDSIITKLAIVMCSYLALDGDHVVQEDSVGDEMYMVVRGEVTLKSKSAPLVNGKTWVDGAFFGELPLLGLGRGQLRNLHVYDVFAATESELTYLSRRHMEDLEKDYPTFKAQIRQLATKRAVRFGLKLTRVTVSVPRHRRMSIGLDDAPPAEMDVMVRGTPRAKAAPAGGGEVSTTTRAAPALALDDPAFQLVMAKLEQMEQTMVQMKVEHIAEIRTLKGLITAQGAHGSDGGAGAD